MCLILSSFGVGVMVEKRGCCAAPRLVSEVASLLLAAVPILVVIRVALVRVVIAIVFGVFGHDGLLSMCGVWN